MSSLSDVVPVMFPPAKHPSLSIFTTAEGAARVAHAVPYQLTIAGIDLVLYLSPEMGLAVIGRKGVAVLDPELLASVRRNVHDEVGIVGQRGYLAMDLRSRDGSRL